jgi:DNA-directed RNA polymerase specialized sigma subunit
MLDPEKSFDEVAVSYHYMIISLIKKLKIRKEVEDFYQIGLIALWNAVEILSLSAAIFLLPMLIP